MKIVKENPNQVDITNEPKILELLKEKLKWKNSYFISLEKIQKLQDLISQRLKKMK